MLELVQPLFCFHVNRMSGFGRWVGSKVNKIATNSNCGLIRNTVFFLLRPNAKQSRFVSLSGLSQVLTVLRKVSFAQICNAIVVNNTVDVVNQVIRPSSVNIEPRKPVRPTTIFAYTDFDVTVFVKSPSNRPTSLCSSCGAPSKNARFRVVMQKLFQSSLRQCKSGFSHVIAPFQRWIGQRIEGVTSTFFPRSSIEGVA